MKPVKDDFIEFLPWSVNIPENMYKTYIEDAYKFDIRPKLETLAVDIYNYADKSEVKPELQAFYDNFVRQWWVLLAFKRFITVHGRNLTQFGYTKTRDPQGTFDQVTQEERAVVLRQLVSDIDMCLIYMAKETWTFDGVQYRKPGGLDCGPRFGSDFGIRALT